MEYTYSNIDLNEKVDYLSDTLVQAIDMVEYTPYHKMTLEQQAQVKVNFHALLKKLNIILTPEVIEATEKEFSNSSPIGSMLRGYGCSVDPKSMFAQSANELKSGRKVTLVLFHEFGFPVLINTVIDHVDVSPYAQHKESLTIIHKPKRKRSLFSNLILPFQELLVFDDWLETDLKKLTHETIKETSEMKMEQSKYRSFDKTFFADIIKSTNIKPIAAVNIQL